MRTEKLTEVSRPVAADVLEMELARLIDNAEKASKDLAGYVLFNSNSADAGMEVMVTSQRFHNTALVSYVLAYRDHIKIK